ncbi:MULTISPECIES: dihydrodipicolinate reductase [unclassified Streptomyces]|uniref:dihydrodipicolinate reductase n=1 Tax=unclassified Streptomyces TaxID=2593676 RepID=UPI00336A30D6
MFRVIQWYTGTIAKKQIKLLAERSDIELVAVVTQTPEKDGVDAGEIAGIGPIGVRATTDVEAALAVEADCVLLNPPFWDGELVARILRSGKNVVTPTGGFDLRGTPFHDALEQAARDGGTTLTGGGNMPGLLNDVMPLVLSGYTSNVRRIWTRERNFHRDYAAKEVLQLLGFGAPVEECAQDSGRAQMLGQAFHWYEGQAAHLVTDALGLKLDELRTTAWEILPAPRELHLPASGLTIPEGTAAGMRYEFTGYVDGKPWHTTVIEHVAELGLGEGWQQSESDPEFTIRVEGDPTISVDFAHLGVDGLIQLNASRIVNLIGPVCAAEPGCRTILELPFVKAATATTD